MEKINYISRREESFWKILGVISGIIYIIFLVIGSFSEETRSIFLLLGLGCMGLSGITGIPKRFYEKDISEIRKRMLSWASVTAVYLTIVAVSVLSQEPMISSPDALKNNLGVKITLLLIIALPLLLFLLLEIFKTKARESHTFFKYLVDEKPAIWKRLFLKDIWGNNYVESTLGILFCVLLFAGFIAALLWGTNK